MSGIVILGNADSFWLQRFVNNVSVPLGQEFYIVSAQNEKYRQYYAEHHINVITTKPKSPSTNILTSKLRAVRTCWNTLHAIRTLKPDLIHVHYAYPYILKLLPHIGSDAHTIVTFWGSDLLRAKASEQKLIRETADKADALVVVAEGLLERLLEIASGVIEKTSVINMGITAFDNIDKRRGYVAEAKRTLMGDDLADRTVITIGYNASRAQQHTKALKCISLLPNEIKAKIAVVLPLTYQDDDAVYLNELEELLAGTGIRGIMLRDFMDDDEIATLCLATDIFVNGQTSDALSASMLEQLYSESIVLNGEWLKYKFLDDNNIDYEKFTDYDDLKEKLVDAIGIVENHGVMTNGNADILRNKFSWEASRRNWEALYNCLE